MAREGLGLGTSIRNYQAIFLYLLAGQGNTALSFESAEVLEDGQCSLISREGLRWYCKDSEDFDGNLFFFFLTKKKTNFIANNSSRQTTWCSFPHTINSG